MLNYQSKDLIAHSPNWSYGDFISKAMQISQTLQKKKIKSIAVWFEDGAQLACLMLAAWQSKVRLIFPPNLTTDSLEWINQYADIIVTDTTTILDNCVYFSELGQQQHLPHYDHFSVVFPTDTEIWLKTSGSTGEAKTIIKTAQQLWLGGKVLAQSLPFADSNQITALSTVSIQHIYGLTVHIMMALAKGWQIGRKQQCYSECVFYEAQQANQVVLISSPAMLSHIDWQKIPQGHNIQGILSSGGALPEVISQQIRQYHNIPVIEIYGSTETGPIAIRDDIHFWQPLPEGVLGCNKEGALWIEASWLSQREQTADVVEFNGKQFRLLGRNDRIVKLGDKRISLIEVENTLLQHHFIDDCYIAPHTQQKRLTAWVALNKTGIDYFRENGRKAILAELKQKLTKSLDRQAIPRFWRLTDKLPRNSQAKIDKFAFEQACINKVQDPIWLEKTFEKQTALCRGKVPLELIYLKDHFANFPLVPGVIELQWIEEQIKQLLNQPLYYSAINKLKYQKFLRPNDTFVLHLVYSPAKQQVKFSLTTDDETCCSGIMQLTDRPE